MGNKKAKSAKRAQKSKILHFWSPGLLHVNRLPGQRMGNWLLGSRWFVRRFGFLCLVRSGGLFGW